jgi:hypothetical protein
MAVNDDREWLRMMTVNDYCEWITWMMAVDDYCE